ncbi:sugar kinase [Halobacillus litoralis]|uniref:sugar kinase n=1 Tax=Halobacillus litoralis TaxID=45668 RepID=UPI0024911D45|nr:sugar kinase [Halobacillus litoralis]
MESLDVVTLGETMVLFGSSDHASLEYANTMQKQIGGAESNVAIGLARLGHSSGWISKLGDDPFGKYVHKFIRGEGVDTRGVTYTKQAPTGIFFKEKLSADHVNVYYYRHQSAASLMEPVDLPDSYISSAKILHITGITPALSESCQDAIFHAIHLAKEAGRTVVFDPNIRYKLWGNKEEAKQVLNRIAELADIILPGVDEAAFLTGETDYEKAAEALKTHKGQTVVVKLGEEGAYYTSAESSGIVPGIPVKNVVDPVGAGDGFAAGVISGVLDEVSLEEAVERGNAVGAFVVQMNGDVEGVPTRVQLQSFIDSGERLSDVER